MGRYWNRRLMCIRTYAPRITNRGPSSVCTSVEHVLLRKLFLLSMRPLLQQRLIQLKAMCESAHKSLDEKVLENRVDNTNDDDDEVFVGESISAGERVARAKAQAIATNQIIVIDESDDEDFDGGGKLPSKMDNSARDKVDVDDTSTANTILKAEPHSIGSTAKRNFEAEVEGTEIKRAKFGKDMM
jgi:hypothetical protein